MKPLLCLAVATTLSAGPATAQVLPAQQSCSAPLSGLVDAAPTSVPAPGRPAAADHAISTKGTGTSGRAAAPCTPAPASGTGGD